MKIRNSVLLFGTMNVPRLFVKLFIPTLMGLIFSAILNLADGIFVGKGVGSDALASVNVAAPIFLVSTGIALLFATGVSIVAAYSVACYLFPLVFMFGNSIAQSSLPIVSYNYGRKNEERIRKAFRLTVGLAVVLGLLITVFCLIESDTLISLFLNEGTTAYQVGCKGFPYFALGFLFFTLNVVFIGFYQSIEQAKRATLWMLLRGVIFVIPSFILLPMMLGDKGLWLAVPLSEMLTFGEILLSLVRDRVKTSK